jgi:hypothetical protein
MLGAVALSVLALTSLTGTDGGLWWSDSSPRAGVDFVAISWTGGGEFQCGGNIGLQSVPTTLYQLGDPATTVCVLHVPKGAAGKKLMVGWALTARDSQRISIEHGAVKPKLIRR